jgi:hypothetical protein
MDFARLVLEGDEDLIVFGFRQKIVGIGSILSRLTYSPLKAYSPKTFIFFKRILCNVIGDNFVQKNRCKIAVFSMYA